MMSTITATPAPAEWMHTDLTECVDRDACPQATHFWPGGAPGPVVE
jgi:hypothetical protein